MDRPTTDFGPLSMLLLFLLNSKRKFAVEKAEITNQTNATSNNGGFHLKVDITMYNADHLLGEAERERRKMR